MTSPARVPDVVRQLRSHRSIRAYAPIPVEDAHVRLAIETGQAASTSNGVQAYSAIRVRDPLTRRALADAAGQAKVVEAGAFLVVCGDTRRHRLAVARAGGTYPGRLEPFLVSVVDASLFAQNVAAAFEALGYGVCFVGGLRNRISDVDRLLAIPEGVYPLFGLCVGVPAEDPLPRPRLPVEGVLFEERYPSDPELLRGVEAYDAEYARYLQARDGKAGTWSAAMAKHHEQPRRTDLADYYASKGAELK